MPDLKDIIKERDVKKFTKKNYRPWDLSGNASSLIDKAQSTQHVSDKTDIKSKSESNITFLPSKIDPTIDITLDTNEISNGYQKDIDLESNQISNEYQKDIKKISSGELTQVNKKTNVDTDSFEKNESITTHIPQRFEETNEFLIEQEIIRLSGKQKVIFDMLVDICSTKNCISTGPIQTASLATFAHTTTGTIKNILKRLIDKQLIIRHQGKNAKGGYINLGITSTVLELIKNIKNNNRTHLFAGDIIMAYRYQKDINPDTNSSINNNITTITNKKIEQIPQEWENINFELLSHIGFSKTQIMQLIGKNDPSIVQESIAHFAYGLDNNLKVKKYEEPLNVLMGVLRKGQSWIEPDYRSPIEIAQQKLLESKRAEIERKKVLEEEAFKLAFDEWLAKITESERQKIAERKNGDFTPQSAKLTIHFRENIWPSVKASYILF